MSLLIKNGRILDPSQGFDVTGDLLLQDGVIHRLERSIETPPQTPVIDARGLMVCPGFIDLHCHLREPGYEEKETVATGTAAAARGGFTTVCAMPNTLPPLDSAVQVKLLLHKARVEGVVKVLPIGCVTRGREGKRLADMAELARAGVIGFSDDGSPVADDRLMRQALTNTITLGLPIIDHCEEPSLSRDGVMNDGPVARRLGLRGVPASAEEVMVARDISLAEQTGGRLHLAHISTAGSVELVRSARGRGIPVTAEATPHHLTITEEWAQARPGHHPPYDTNAKVNPPLRTLRDVAALVQGLRDGTIDCIATDHAPHTLADKACSFEAAAFGISGLETALGALMSLVHRGEIDLATLVERLTLGPARVANRPEVCSGTLQSGSPADVTIFDPEMEWVVDSSKLVSRGKNTPLEGATLKGKVVATIIGGRIAYQDKAVKVG